MSRGFTVGDPFVRSENKYTNQMNLTLPKGFESNKTSDMTKTFIHQCGFRYVQTFIQ